VEIRKDSKNVLSGGLEPGSGNTGTHTRTYKHTHTHTRTNMRAPQFLFYYSGVPLAYSQEIDTGD